MTAATLPQDRAASVRQMYRLVARFHPDWKPYLIAGITAAGTSFCEAGTLVLLTLSAASIAKEDSANTIGGIQLEQSEMLAIAAVLLGVRLLLSWMNARTTSGLAMRCLLETRRQLLRAFTTASWERQSRQQQGIIYDLMASRADVVGYSALILCGMVVNTINLAVLGVAALVLQPIAVVALAVVGGLMGFILRPLNTRTRLLARQYLRANEQFVNSITDLTHNARDLKAYGVGARFMDQIVEQQRDAVDLYRRRTILTQFTPQAYQTLGLGLAVAGLAVAASFGGDNLATLGAVVLLLLRGISYGQALMTSSQALNERVPWVGSLTDTLDEFAADQREPGTVVPEGPITLDLDGVQYRYDGDDLVLQSLDLHIEPGERVGVVGPSGGGKSTLLQILAGLRTPTGGSYRVGNEVFETVDPDWWSRKVALVSQDSRMLTNTVAANIDILRMLPREELERAAAQAQLTDDIAVLGGFDTPLSREGRALSGGQMQRLAIARAFAGDPALLLLDEPTSALDVATEGRLQAALDTIHGQTTMVIVAHRLSTVASCDRILVVEQGKLVADGPPSVVLSRFDAKDLAAWEIAGVEPDDG